MASILIRVQEHVTVVASQPERDARQVCAGAVEQDRGRREPQEGEVAFSNMHAQRGKRAGCPSREPVKPPRTRKPLVL